MWKTSEKVTFTQPLANSTAEGNEERIHASVESSRSWETRAAWAGLLDGDSRPPAARPPLAGSLNHNPICLSCLFSAGLPRGCSFDGQVQRSCVSVCEVLSELAHTHSCQNTWDASSLHSAVGAVEDRMGTEELQPSASVAASRSAGLRWAVWSHG